MSFLLIKVIESRNGSCWRILPLCTANGRVNNGEIRLCPQDGFPIRPMPCDERDERVNVDEIRPAWQVRLSKEIAVSLFGGPQLSWNTLAIFSRSLGTMLHSGVNILKSFQVAGAQSLDLKLQRD